MNERLRSNGVLAVWLLLVTVVSLLPYEIKHALGTTGRFHACGHVTVFAVTSCLLCARGRSGRAMLLLAAVGVFFGWTTEMAEHLHFGNEMEWWDVASDSVGVMLGFFCIACLSRAEFALQFGIEAPDVF